MSKNCARCNKVVYAIEELKCLEKIWHKTCFKCTECNMVLNMKTYKGFNKSPYCEAHIPKAKATTIAETPEYKRIAENTKIQSNVKYHADFEKTKGKLTQVADDPETLRIRQNTKNISNASYHGEYLKKEKMEKQRELADVVGDNKDLHESEYFSETLAAENISDYRPRKYDYYEEERRDTPTKKSPIDENPMIHSSNSNNNIQHHQQQPLVANNHKAPTYRQPEMPTHNNNNSNSQNLREREIAAYKQQQLQLQQQQRQQQLLYQQQMQQQQLQQQMLENNRHLAKQQQLQQQQFLKNEAINNYNANQIDHSMNHRNNLQNQNDNYAEMLQYQYMEQAKMLSQTQQQQPFQQQTATNNHNIYQQAPNPKPVAGKVRVYRALYDYEAQDSDEVSFYEGDMIIEMNEIDSGWLTGRVDRTGKVGLVPANYLEIQNI